MKTLGKCTMSLKYLLSFLGLFWSAIHVCLQSITGRKISSRISFYVKMLSSFLLWGYNCHPTFHHTHSERSWSLHRAETNHIHKEAAYNSQWCSKTLHKQVKSSKVNFWMYISIHVRFWFPVWPLCPCMDECVCVKPYLSLLWARQHA